MVWAYAGPALQFAAVQYVCPRASVRCTHCKGVTAAMADVDVRGWHRCELQVLLMTCQSVGHMSVACSLKDLLY